MCGIAGLWTFGPASAGELTDAARSMAAALRHRGPDDEGSWCDAAGGLALGFRRLAIIDPTETGAQPMVSASGRFVIVFNGEVYNYRLLRERLSGRAFRGGSDTETMLACIEEWGIERAVESFVGMFAFAVWDAHDRRLTLARDRAGVKPLYYASAPGSFAFASELKAMPPRVPREIDRGALGLYARFGYVPAPWSIFEGIRKVAPGSILSVERDGSVSVRSYWSAPQRMEHAVGNRFAGTESEALECVEEALADSVRLRLISDVPLGLFLSGGVDSPLVAAMMRREAGRVATFTVGIDGPNNEAPRAAAIARHLGTDHTEAVVGAAEVIDLVPRLAAIYDEPFADSSAIPTFLVSRLARESVTVALSGDGGDELFGGYHRYFLGERVMQRVARVPRPLRPRAGAALRRLSALPFLRNLADRMQGLGTALVLDDAVAKYLHDAGSSTLPVTAAPERTVPFLERETWPKVEDPTELMMFLDFIGYLPDGILTKVDRASMAVSLEVREPLLDHRLVELAWSLPRNLKLRDGRGKWILRRLLERHVPPGLVEQEKFGFGLPIDRWLAGPLRDWAAALLDPRRIRGQGWFEPEAVARLWNRGPAAGRGNEVWRLLVFQQWLESNGSR